MIECEHNHPSGFICSQRIGYPVGRDQFDEDGKPKGWCWRCWLWYQLNGYHLIFEEKIPWYQFWRRR